VVVDSGIPFNPNSTADVAHVKECSDTASGIQCMEVGTLLPDNPETMNRGEYVWGGVVRLTQLLLLPSGDAVVCHGTNCFVRVFGSFDNGTDQRQIGTDVPVAFIGPK
jgi:hypothetical protein